MNITENKVVARFGAKATWIALWILAVSSLAISLRALSVVKPAVCIVMCVLAFVFSLAGTFVGVCAGKTRLEVTEDYIFCSKIFKSSYCLPLGSVTGVKTGLFNTICITSASFKIRCCFVKNRDEILEAVKKSFEK